MKRLVQRYIQPLCYARSPQFPNGMTYTCNLPASHLGTPVMHQHFESSWPEVPTWDDDRSTDQ